MRFTAVVNLSVIVLALAVGAAALIPGGTGKSGNLGLDPMLMGPSHLFFPLVLCLQHSVAWFSSIELDSECTNP
jgi:hypothetical protein